MVSRSFDYIPVERRLVLAGDECRTEGLDYLAVAQYWNVSKVSPEQLERATHDLNLPGFTLTWNLEAPKNYWRGDASHTLGHGWTVADASGLRGQDEH